jgi:predicted Fe-Mo cluster-binding NifX family protein
MKIAASSTGKTLNDSVDQRFGRCPYFLIVEIEDKKIQEFKAVENTAASQMGKAGIAAAQTVAEEEVGAVITGNLGPNAADVLGQFGIKAYKGSGKIKDAVIAFIEGKLNEITEFAEAHTGLGQELKKDKERIFFPLLDDKGMDSEISSHFGHAPFFGLYNTETKKLEIIENNLDHADPTKSPVDQIVEAVNPTTVYAQGIGGRAIGLFAEKGVKLKTGPYTKVKEVIDNLDKLEDLTEGCGQH